ncbi:MAG: hypothetical protein ACJ8AT_03495 [Hyalangium sp.]|uniref:hypothetical protein n=1 Tax=Hyalangium sp. TaxID=2028555 RepID=UPI00389A963B
MRRFLEPWLLLASLLVAGLVFAQPSPPAAAAPAKATAAQAPPPAPMAEPAAGDEDAGTDEADSADEADPEDEAAADDENAVEPDEPEEPPRSGYADLTGTLEALDETDGLRVSLHTGGLKAKRGFTPIEVSLHNTEAVPRSLRLSFQGYGSGASTTVRTVELAPRQRLTTYLLVPVAVQNGTFTIEGPTIRPRTGNVYLDEGTAVATLVLGTAKAFEAGTGIPRTESGKPSQVDVRFLSVQDAPRELAAYVGYPSVLVTEDVASVPADVWAALENYAAVGGSLVLARSPRDVRQRLPLLGQEPERDAWNAYGFGSVYLCQGGAEDCGKAVASVEEESKPLLEPIGPAPRWENNRFALRGGEVPLLPNALVPVGRFLVLIFLFSLVVGPGGLMLARRKGPVALLIGVPAVALLTCLIIIGDSVLGEGFVTHASRYSYTWLDRPRDRVVTAAVAGYYANLSSDKVQLPATGVLLAPQELDEWLVDVSWTGGGMEAEGLLPARTYVEWGELAVVPTRARLVVRKEGEGWKVQNALGAPLQAGYVRLGKSWYSLPELADGAEGSVAELKDDASGELVRGFVSPPGSAMHRSREDVGSFALPLKDGDFVARLGGAGFAPLAALKVQLHEGVHYVRGQVDTP